VKWVHPSLLGVDTPEELVRGHLWLHRLLNIRSTRPRAAVLVIVALKDIVGTHRVAGLYQVYIPGTTDHTICGLWCFWLNCWCVRYQGSWWSPYRTPHLPAISSNLISSRAWARSSGVEVFLCMLTTPNPSHKVDSVHFLHRRSLVLWLEVCMAHTLYVEPRKPLIQSYQLLIGTETTPILLSTELFKSSLQLIVWGV
jgi:hypothetical protein